MRLQNGRCKHWNTVFAELAFNSTLGFPGEGPTTGSIFDFFRRQDSGCAASGGNTAPAETPHCNTTEDPLPIDPEGLCLHELLVAYTEEVLCNPAVSGKGIYAIAADSRGR
jgi:hypothetical protein